MSSNVDYELFNELGRGRFTIVHRAYDRKLQRYVAIKELSEEFRNDQRRKERFLKHAQFLAALNHDNVLRVHTLEPAQGWIVMELMEGSMADKMREGAVDAELARSVLRQSLTALEYLHEQGRIHGKVRPSNILINDQGRVKLSDFENVERGGVLPSPTGDSKYMAPELLKPDEFGAIGPQLDLYCLGATTLELLAGGNFATLLPGIGQSMDLDMAWMRWHGASDPYPSAATFIRGLPADLTAALDQMLQKHVNGRPRDAKSVLAKLANAPLKKVELATSHADVNTSVDTSLPAQKQVSPTPATTCPTRPSSEPSPFITNQSSSTSSKVQPNKSIWFDLSNPKVFRLFAALVLISAASFGLWASGALSTKPEGGLGLNRVVNPVENLEVTFLTQPSEVSVSEAGVELTPIEPNGNRYYLPAGEHELTFEKEGFEGFTRKFDISAKSTRFDNIQLASRAKPKPTEVANNPRKETSSQQSDVQKVSKPPVETKLQLREVMIESEPPGAEISIDGKSFGEVTPAVISLPIGSHDLELRLGNTLMGINELVEVPTGNRQLQLVFILEKSKLAAMQNSLGMSLVPIPPGEFLMGASEGDSDESPRHIVKITELFYLGKFEVTVGDFEQFVTDTGHVTDAERSSGAYGYDVDKRRFIQDARFSWRNVGWSQSNTHPVVNVSWHDAHKFCQWLSEKENKNYSLPTEAQWEYACRGGTKTRYWVGDQSTNLAQTDNLADERLRSLGLNLAVDQFDDGQTFTSPVGSYGEKGTNPLGVCDMHGNIREFCQDTYTSTYYASCPKNDPLNSESGNCVTRGGSWYHSAVLARSSFRTFCERESAMNYVGFRIVLQPEK